MYDLVTQPKQRLGIDPAAVLSHKFFSTVDWKAITDLNQPSPLQPPRSLHSNMDEDDHLFSLALHQSESLDSLATHRLHDLSIEYRIHTDYIHDSPDSTDKEK